MTATRIALAGAALLGLTGLWLGLPFAGGGPDIARADSVTMPACGSCDARHQRLGQLHTTIVRNEP